MPDIGSLAIQAPKDIFDLDTALQQFFGGSPGTTILLVLADYLVEGAFNGLRFSLGSQDFLGFFSLVWSKIKCLFFRVLSVVFI